MRSVVGPRALPAQTDDEAACELSDEFAHGGTVALDEEYRGKRVGDGNPREATCEKQ